MTTPSDPGPFRQYWSLAEDVVHLNHGSFGLIPNVVRQARRDWIDRLDRNPYAFYLYELEAPFRQATERVAQWVGAAPRDIALLDNATVAMNAVATSFPLEAGDQVLITDHDYGAVQRIWQRACQRAGAKLVTVQLPFPPESDEQIIETLCGQVTDQTQMAIFSHITSPSALVLPVQQLCRRLAALGVATCIDGPHGITQLPVDMAEIDCDYYAASLHKWTCAPPGSGFLYANPRAQADLEPVDLSWGRLQPHKVEHWNEEFWWRGTRDMTANLTVPVALDFLESIGIDHFRQRTHQLARLGSEMISELAGCRPVVDVDRWHASMVLVQIPNADPFKLRDTLFHQYHIASAIMQWEQRRYLRISCHLYNDESDLEKLAVAVDQSLKSGL